MKWKRILFVAALFLSGAGPLTGDTITLGYVDFPPYEYTEDGKPTGILVEIVQAVFRKADIRLELKFMPFKRALNEAKSGQIDGLFNFYKNDNRLKFYDYSEPVIENPLVFFVRKDADISFSTLKDLRGLRIGVMRGYTYGANFDASVYFTLDEANSHLSNFKKLMYGRVDAYPCDKMVGIYVSRQEGFMSEFKILSKPLKIMDGHIGFTKDKHTDVVKKINEVISAMKEKKEIQAIFDKFLEKI